MKKKHPTKAEYLKKDIQYQREVLERMIARGCKACELKNQERHIARLKEFDII